MASSGRVPNEVKALMGTTIKVSQADPATTLYGKQVAADEESKREVTCMIQPAMSASRSHESTDVTYTWDIYCDDINIVEGDVVELPDGYGADGDTPAITGIETYSDEQGPMYQVVHC